MRADAPDAIVVGSGPNGLAAAITLARAGRSVVVYEAKATIGGGMRSGELTLPGFVHDICSTVQGTSTASPFFRDLDLARFGVELIDPPAPLAHPLDGGRVAVLERSVADTAMPRAGEDVRTIDLRTFATAPTRHPAAAVPSAAEEQAQQQQQQQQQQ